jgi:hypothetical protein
MRTDAPRTAEDPEDQEARDQIVTASAKIFGAIY